MSSNLPNKAQNKQVTFLNLGLIDYQEGWDYQEKLFAEIIAIKVKNRTLVAEEKQEISTPNYLLFCQHSHVYTLGKSGKIEHLLLNEESLEEKDAKFYKINRGGDITYHGPGQLVGYPILDLDNFFTDIHKYMRFLEEAIILTLAEYNINAGRITGLTGVWLDYETQAGGVPSGSIPLGDIPQNPRKICAMGVKSSRWVTMHGFALNVNTDLNYFSNIVPCGIDDKAVTSMAKELNQVIDIQEVSLKLKAHLGNLFEMKFDH